MRDALLRAAVRMDDPVDLGVDLGSGDRWPFMRWIKETAGELQFVLLILVGVLLAVGVAMWIAGRLTTSQRVQAVSAMIIPIALIGAMILGAAFGLIGWAAGFDIGFN